MCTVSTSTYIENERIKLLMEEAGPASQKPISVPGLLHKTAQEYPDYPALAFKSDDRKWNFITYRTCAKAFLKLGLQRYHSVCIVGCNSPEWYFSSLGAIYAGGFSAGMYPTNTADACKYCADKCKANIIVVEDNEQLNKILKIKDSLKYLKAIIQYHGEPEVESIISWKKLLKIGEEVSDSQLDDVMKTICINECCSILFTSGTTDKPKAAMLSHDNITWCATTVPEETPLQIGKEVVVGYLPLNHIAAQTLEMYKIIYCAGIVYFADKDAIKGSVIKTVKEVRPTYFFGVPRIWEKIYEKIQTDSTKSGKMKGTVFAWAQKHSLQHYIDKMNGKHNRSASYFLSKILILPKVKKELGFDRCRKFMTGGAPTSVDIKKFFMSFDIPVLEVFGMTESSGIHVQNTLQAFNFEAIGKDRPGVCTRIENPDEEGYGEICYRGRHVFMGYLGDPEKTAEALQNEWLHSGDLGKIDEDGFITITGRIKELIITSGGENIAPVLIEEEVKKELPCIRNAMVVGDRRKYLTVLLTMKSELNPETGEPLDELMEDTKQWCREVGCEVNTVKDVLEGPNEKDQQ
ncbi:Long-chain-fatty-acid--CoA ligase ACSBG2 [Blattella germanica]|nr:Long-chain-fatty-acid--CoA ligase ACSBG2 [Blattella germanica]